MDSPTPEPEALRAHLVDFALGELVRQHRESFQPLWTVEAWAKLLIWLALNCGVDGGREGLETFAAALGPRLTARMRRLFFERELEQLELKLMADPADQQVLVMPLGPAPLPPLAQVAEALALVGLGDRVPADPSRWQILDGVVVVPWLPLP